MRRKLTVVTERGQGRKEGGSVIQKTWGCQSVGRYYMPASMIYGMSRINA